MVAQNKRMTWSGRALSGLVGLMLVFSASMKLKNAPQVAEQLVGKFGYAQEVIAPLGVVEISCVIVYLIPQTAVLGAILLTGYLGGATATHVRIGDPFISPVIGGMLVWLALFLRDPRIRALVPWRSASLPPPAA
jgi:hypothetical protein